jgi:preprotein translocase subunit SecA
MVTEEEQLETLYKTLETWVAIPEDLVPENIHAAKREAIKQDLIDLVSKHYEQRGTELRKQAQAQGLENFDAQRDFERTYLLQVVDRLWMDHIDALDVMRAGIGFRAVGQRDPLVEFKNEAYRMFEELKVTIQHYTVDALLKLLRNEVTITLQRPEPPRKAPEQLKTNADQVALASGQAKSNVSEEHARSAQKARRNGHVQRGGTSGTTRSASGSGSNGHAPAMGKVGRNEPCPCGSGKKYKKCHGA